MPLGDFRSAYLPYCLKRLKDGRYVVLNREYKPLGFITLEHIEYEQYPIASNILGIGESTAAKLSWKNDPNLDVIFLYNDGCVPTESEANMKSYLEKIKILAKLKLKNQP